MTDVFSKEKRSEVMSHIKSQGNKATEIAFIRIMRKHHISGWRRNYHLLGKPDFVFPKQKLAIFVDGCFWHLCPNHCKIPKNNRAFWKIKLKTNRARDLFVTRKLKIQNWMVLRIWEHELPDTERVVKKISRALGK